VKLRFFLASLSTFGMVSALQGSPSRLFDFQNGTPEPIVMVLCGVAALAVAGVLRRIGTLQPDRHDSGASGRSQAQHEAPAHS
jgi:hypothetical protein